MNTLFSENITAQEWCDEIISRQKKIVYNSLTNPENLNHIVKENLDQLINFKKNINETTPQDDIKKVCESILILYHYCKNNRNFIPSKEKPLNEDELEKAFSELYVEKFMKCDRKYCDPPIMNQAFAIYSFNPSYGVKPDKDGTYGFIKIRGVFSKIEEAQEKAKELIQYFSANQIFVCEVGKPTPMSEKVADESNVIKVLDPDEEKHENLMKEQSLKEKKIMEEIKVKADLLIKDVKEDSNVDPLQHYILLKHKKGDLCLKYISYKKQLGEIKESVLKTRKQIAEMDTKYPELQNEYIEHYNETCKERGIDQNTDYNALMIRKFMDTEPEEIDF